MEASLCNDEVELSPVDLSLLKKILGDETETTKKGILTVNNQENKIYKSGFTFEQFELKADLYRGIYNLGYERPSLIQSAVLKIFCSEPLPMDFIVQSQNGTGKTAAYALAILQSIDCSKNYTQSLIVVSTYELGLQVCDVFHQLGKYIDGLRVYKALRLDGSEPREYAPITEPIVVGTPGKLNYLIGGSCLDVSKLDIFVVDEADMLMDTGSMGAQVKKIMRHLPRGSSVFFFTATLENHHLAVFRMLTRDAHLIRLRNHELSLPHLHQYYVMCSNDEEKFKVIIDIYKTLVIGQCIIFCATKTDAHKLAAKLQNVGFSLLILAGDLTVADRAKTIKEFRKAKSKVLITTNVCSRGIDIACVNLVINFQVPVLASGQPDYASYLHRIGRGGRFGVAGVAISLAKSQEDVNIIRSISQFYGSEIKHLPRENLHSLETVVYPEVDSDGSE